AGPGSVVWTLGELDEDLLRDVAATGATVIRGTLDPMAELVHVHPLALALAATACTGGGGGGTATGSGGQIHLVMWMGYTPPPPANQSYEYLSIERMVKEFEKQNPNITIELQYVNSDYALQKATVAIQGNKQPDISYQYGTNMPQ